MRCYLGLLLGVILTLCACPQDGQPISAFPDQCQIIHYDLNHQIRTENLAVETAEYELKLKVGNQDVGVVVDTGSSNLILIGDASICPGCNADTEYTPGPNAKKNREAISLSYGSGSVQAVEYQDTVGFTCNANPISYTFGVATEEKNIPNILGLAYIALAQPEIDPIKPFFEQLVDSQGLANVFSLTLCEHLKGSNIKLGGFDPRVAPSDIKLYVPIVEETYYTTNAQSLSVKGSNQILGSFGANSKVIIDSGTTMNMLPPAMVDSIIALLKSEGSKVGISFSDNFFNQNAGTTVNTQDLDDATVAKLPTLVIQLESTNQGSISLEMSPLTYLKDMDGGNGLKRAFGFRYSSGTLILGQVLMQNYMVVFDRANKRLGFYPSLTSQNGSAPLCQ